MSMEVKKNGKIIVVFLQMVENTEKLYHFQKCSGYIKTIVFSNSLFSANWEFYFVASKLGKLLLLFKISRKLHKNVCQHEVCGFCILVTL